MLHDLVFERDTLPRAAIPEGNPTVTPSDYLICPVSYANDEPIDEILAAARLTPRLSWRLTGRAPARVRDRAPHNVEFTGFVEPAAYDEMLRRSLGVVALTTRKHTMQRAGYEAFSAGVPLLTSDFPELREFHAHSACYARPQARAIAAAAHELVARRDDLVRALIGLRPQRIAAQRTALDEVRHALHGARGRLPDDAPERHP